MYKLYQIPQSRSSFSCPALSLLINTQIDHTALFMFPQHRLDALQVLQPSFPRQLPPFILHPCAKSDSALGLMAKRACASYTENEGVVHDLGARVAAAKQYVDLEDPVSERYYRHCGCSFRLLSILPSGRGHYKHWGLWSLHL
jgi:hypothetical protein